MTDKVKKVSAIIQSMRSKVPLAKHLNNYYKGSCR